MASQLTKYNIFVASPGGLEAERRVFKDIISAHNEADALARNCYFQPIGWEVTLGGIGRPQEKINEELRQCDIFVMILWDRWGSPTGAKEGYTSGTHEEYKIAQKDFKDPKAPMREIIVFFKAVDGRRLSDPGPQLSAVLDFKRSLEQEKSMLFETFDTPDAFGDKLRKHVAKWTREHEISTEGRSSKISSDKNSSKDIEIQASDPSDLKFISNIQQSEGYTEAERKLADDVISKRDMTSFDRYGIFLIQAERYSDALSLYQEMQKLAKTAGDTSWSSTAVARIGGVYRAQGRSSDALAALSSALQEKEQIGDRKGAASVNVWIGDLLFKQKQVKSALSHYSSALDSTIEMIPSREPDLRWKIAKCLAETGSKDQAKDMANIAYTLFEQQGNAKGMQAIKSWRKARRLA